MKVIFDTSSLILIAKIDILRVAAERMTVIIPPQVQREALILIHLAIAGQYSSDLALEKLNTLSKYGRYKPQIIEDAARRIREGKS